MNDTSLPPGSSCANCVHFPRCRMLFDCEPSSTTCAYAPSRFSPRPIIPPSPQWSPYPGGG